MSDHVSAHSVLGNRIRLRPIEMLDLDCIHELHLLPETDEFNTLGIPKSIEETKNIIEPWIAQNKVEEVRTYTFAIERISDGEFLGLFGLKLGDKKYRRGEVWYKIHSNYWNRGYATESLRAVIKFGFETLKLHRIEAGCAIDNIASIRVLEKVGMTKEGRARKILPLKTGWSDNFHYAIVESDEWNGSHQPKMSQKMRIEHIAIWTRDLDTMKEFYLRYFDLTSNEKYVNTSKNFSSYFLAFAGGARIELMHRPDIVDVLKQADSIIGLTHFAISVGSKAKVDALTEQVRADGYEIFGEPRTTGDGYYESVIADPEGNLIEITA